jgi:hypothetical protein
VIETETGNGFFRLLPSQILIVTDRSINGGLSGKLFSGYYHKVYGFKNEYDLIFGINQICDHIGLPGKYTDYRSFKIKHIKTVTKEAYEFMDDEIYDTVKNGKATFLIHIQYRKNATWQGSITWVQKNKTQNFRSALEMLQLMGEAQNPGVKETIAWDKSKNEAEA